MLFPLIIEGFTRKKQWIRIVYYNINQLLTALFGI